MAKRYKRSPHPGVVLHARRLPSGARSWRARFRDPDTGKDRYVALGPLGLTTAEARREWAIAKSRQLAARRRELELGAAPKTETPLAGTIDEYLQARARQMRPDTLVADQKACDRLLTWARQEGLSQVEDLTPARLAAFRESRVAAPKQAQVKEGGRGARHTTGGRRSPATVNHELRPVLALLNRWRRLGLVDASRDQLGEVLKPLRVPHSRPEFLTPTRCQELLAASLRHDAATYKETAAEHRGEGEKGTTPRYEPVAPFLAFLLLTGCRVKEALELRWADIDLDARDINGKPVGEIQLDGAATKTRRHRRIGFEVAPTLRKLLAALRLRSGGAEYVFGGDRPMPRTRIEAARKRLSRSYGAPAYTWQHLRQTTAVYLTNAPSIFGGSSAYQSASQLGHSVAVAERHYVEQVRGIPVDATTLERALEIDNLMDTIVTRTRGMEVREHIDVRVAG